MLQVAQYIDPTLKMNIPKALVIAKNTPNVTYNRTTCAISSTGFNVQRNFNTSATILHPFLELELPLQFVFTGTPANSSVGLINLGVVDALRSYW